MFKRAKPFGIATGHSAGSTSFPSVSSAPYDEDDVDESGFRSMTMDCAEVTHYGLTFNSTYYGLKGYTFIRAQLSQDHDEGSVVFNHDLLHNIVTVDPYSVLICGKGPHQHFRQQVAMSMLATMVANPGCAPFKLALDQCVHILLQPHEYLEAEKEEYLKLGFVHIATYRRDRDPGGLYNTADVVVDTGSLRLAGVVGDVLMKSGWIDSSSELVIQTPLFAPSPVYTINIDNFHQKKLALLRQQLEDCLVCFNYLQSAGVRCELDRREFKIRLDEDLARELTEKLRVQFPRVDVESCVSAIYSDF
jgi:hypothetical protein